MQMRKKAFTLVELLVVIGIILVLASILMPALLKAKESANRATCLANIRSIGQAMHIYANENESKFSVGGGATATACTANESFGGLYNEKTFNDMKVYVCPNRKRNNPPSPPAQGSTTRALVTEGVASNNRIISYDIVLADDNTGGGGASVAVKPLATDNGNNILLIEDFSFGENAGKTGATAITNNNQSNHGAEGCNVYRINGSAGFFKGSKTSTDSTNFPLAADNNSNVSINGLSQYNIDPNHIVRQNP